MAIETLSLKDEKTIRENNKKNDVVPIHIKVDNDVVILTVEEITKLMPEYDNKVAMILVPKTNYVIPKSEIRDLLAQL